MQNDTLLALLLDPFLTFEEAAKEFRTATESARGPRPAHPKPTAPSRPSGASRRPARNTGSGVPVVHHPPANAG